MLLYNYTHVRTGLRDHDRSRSIVKCATPRSIKGVRAPIDRRLIVDRSRSTISKREEREGESERERVKERERERERERGRERERERVKEREGEREKEREREKLVNFQKTRKSNFRERERQI